MNSLPLYQNIRSTVKWNMIESILYSSAMLIHQTILFYSIDQSLYGQIGALFSFVFLSEYLLCFGLNDILGTFFHLWHASQKNFKTFFTYNIIAHYILMIPYAALFIFIASRTKYFNNLSFDIMLTLSIIAILEMMKRLSKTILHIVFRSKEKAYIELIGFLLYLVLVWGGYFLGMPITPLALLIPMLITSLFTSLCFLYTTYFYVYVPLPHSSPVALDQPLWIRIIKQRIVMFGYKTSQRLLSGNFMIPAFAATFGMHHAAILKYAKQVAYYSTLILKKTLGNASNVLFVHTRYEDQKQIHLRWVVRVLMLSMGCLAACLPHFWESH
jgi:hypothetical protein